MPIEIDLYDLTEEELVALNHEVIARLKQLRQVRRYEQMAAFAPGDRVSFMDERGSIVSGIVVRFNQKSVTLLTDGGVRWRVSPGLLVKAFDATVAPTKPLELHPGPLFEPK